MRTTLTTDDRDLVDRFRVVDESLRKSFAALPVDDVVREVTRSMDDLAIDLTDDALRAYAQSIADRTDHELVLPR